MAYTKTATNSNPPQLEKELRLAFAVPITGLSVYRITGTSDSFIYYDGNLTQAQQNKVDQVCSAHVPDYTIEDEKAEVRGYISDFKTAFQNWDTLTDDEKFLLLKKLIRVLGIILL